MRSILNYISASYTVEWEAAVPEVDDAIPEETIRMSNRDIRKQGSRRTATHWATDSTQHEERSRRIPVGESPIERSAIYFPNYCG